MICPSIGLISDGDILCFHLFISNLAFHAVRTVVLGQQSLSQKLSDYYPFYEIELHCELYRRWSYYFLRCSSTVWSAISKVCLFLLLFYENMRLHIVFFAQNLLMYLITALVVISHINTFSHFVANFVFSIVLAVVSIFPLLLVAENFGSLDNILFGERLYFNLYAQLWL